MNNACLEYESQFLVETFNESFLLIASKGLCVERFFFKHLQLYSDPSVLVLIVGANKADQEYFSECLIKTDQPAPKCLTAETGTTERRGLYLEGGIQFATTTILISDLLSDRIPMHLVTGILVYRAHSVLRSALESFILLMFRKKKPEGFIKAFSDSPSSFVRSFGQLQRAVGLLRVERVRFLPRYQVDVVENLEKFRPHLVEFGVQLTPSMKTCQNCLLELINACVMELKRCQLPTTTTIDENELTLDFALLPWFEDRIRRQLETNLDKISDKIQHLLHDISKLRQLLVSLEIEDGKTFAKSLEQIKNNPLEYRNNSGWLFTSTAEKLMQVGTKRTAESPTKFNALKNALKELFDLGSRQSVLVIVSEQKVGDQLKDVIKSYTQDDEIGVHDDFVLPKTTSIDVGFENAELTTTSDVFRIILLSHTNHYDILRSLNVFQPSGVIIFNVDVWLIRQLELFYATRETTNSQNFRIYFLMYQNSAEEQRYLTSLKHERDSFEQLFKEETSLLIRKDVVDHPPPQVPNNKYSTTIVVDLREFRSELPMLLHLRDLKLIPATLTVGDYVLSPEICVERKAAADLVGSLQSGRLFNQCRAMCAYYERPFILVELNQQSKKGWRRVGDHCSAKLAVLSLNFPQIRFVWAASPSAAADLLTDFKWKRAEPDVEKAVEYGKEKIGQRNTKSLFVERMLLNLPGFSSKNVDLLAKKSVSLRDICKMDEQNLNSELLKSSTLSKNLYNFFRHDFRLSNVNKSDTKTTRKRK